MELSDELLKISKRISEKGDRVETEEATKTAFILPFIRLVLGYDHTDPDEFIPEFTADVPGKKGEKVDYAIIIDGKPKILIECKPTNTDLDKVHAAQLRKYYNITEAKFGILTNGIIYRFFTDIDKTNIMDLKPFFELDLINVTDSDKKELEKFTKSAFNEKNITEDAIELKYKSEMKKIITKEFKDPSDEFVKFFVKGVDPRIRLAGNAKKQFKQITKLALKEFINGRVDERLEKALDSEKMEEETSEKIVIQKDKIEIVTIEEELEGYYIVKAILSNIVDPSRVTIRDRVNYCTVLLDNKQNKLICRLWFNSKQKYIGLFDKQEKNERGGKLEDKIPIDNINEIYKHSERLRTTAKIYN